MRWLEQKVPKYVKELHKAPSAVVALFTDGNGTQLPGWIYAYVLVRDSMIVPHDPNLNRERVSTSEKTRDYSNETVFELGGTYPVTWDGVIGVHHERIDSGVFLQAWEIRKPALSQLVMRQLVPGTCGEKWEAEFPFDYQQIPIMSDGALEKLWPDALNLGV